jgi:hypothetical protein
MKKKKKSKTIKHICGNCKLFDPQIAKCRIVILHEGQRVNLPVDPEDSCFFEGQYFDPTEKAKKNFTEDIQQVRFWVEDDQGKPTNKDGTVKIEYPPEFFGGRTLSEILGG